VLDLHPERWKLDPSSPGRRGGCPAAAVLLIKRRLDDSASGSAVYLLEFLRCLADGGFAIHLVIAPEAGFGNNPLMPLDPAFDSVAASVVFPRSIRIGRLRISLSWRVWMRAAGALRRTLRRVVRRVLRAPVARPDEQATLSRLGKVPDGPELAALAAAANRLPADLVVAEYSSLGPALAACAAPCRAVLLHDLFSLRARSFFAEGLEPDHVAIPIEAEAAWLASADLCLYASISERQALAPLLPGARHVWLPPRPACENLPGGAGPPRAVFIGVQHGSNADALALLLHEIWPGVHRAAPEAELWIVGEIGSLVEAPPAGVRVLGRVETLAGIGGPDAVGVAPNRVGSGISIKIATYLGLGMAVVALPTALDGYDGQIDDLVVTVPDVDRFRAELVDLLTDPVRRQAIAMRGFQRVRSRLDQHEVRRVLARIRARQPLGPVPDQREGSRPRDLG
jgi:hypothetical protein